MKLLALLFLLSTFSMPIMTEVVGKFDKKCPSFFLPIPGTSHRAFPTILKGSRYKCICQRWNNLYRFATLYDIKSRIPVYSAYTFTDRENTQRDYWKIEPMLDNIAVHNLRDMIEPSENQIREIINQAHDGDYHGSGFDRGHLYPNNFAANQDQAKSTFTLTNIAPQLLADNGKWANQVENPMLRLILQKCRLDQNHQAYIVTGVVPGNNGINITRKGDTVVNGIIVPSQFWSAFCCTSMNDAENLIGKAYLADMGNFNLRQLSIANLNNRLADLYKEDGFNVFSGLDLATYCTTIQN